MFRAQGTSRPAALFALAVALSSSLAFAQTWDWTIRPASTNRVDSQPDTLSPPDARGFWSFGTALVHYHADGSLDFVGASPGVQGGSLAATLSDGSLIVATPSHQPEITFGQPIWCTVTAYSAQGMPRWTQANRAVENQDLVLWYTLGVTHIPRPEEWPVMTCHRAGFKLMPSGFFTRNPALDVPK